MKRDNLGGLFVAFLSVTFCIGGVCGSIGFAAEESSATTQTASAIDQNSISASTTESTSADASTNSSKRMHDRMKPSLVAVKYTWASELGSQELTAAGIIVGSDGLVAFPIGIVTPGLIPNEQMKSFKIIVPSETEDETEIDATFQGRDERSSMAFVKADKPQQWKAINFVDVQPEVGDKVFSVGLLPKGAGYKTYVTMARMAVRLRGPVPQVLVDGNLAGVGAVIADAKGEAIGYVHARSLNEAFLDNPENPDDMPMVTNPPHLYIPSSDFLLSLKNPPTPEKPPVIPWTGCEMKGLEKEDAEYYGLKNIPAVQIGNVIADGPADKAGLKRLDVVVKIDGQPIQRGDVPAELPAIATHRIQRMAVGQKVTFSIIQKKGDAPKDLELTLEARPKQPFETHRFYAKDLGFVVRDVTFMDTYVRKMSPKTNGVVVAMLRPQAAAQAAKLSREGLVTQMNGKPVTDLEEFKKDYLGFRKDRPSDPVVLEVSETDGKQRTINIEPPQNDAQPGNH